MRSLRIFHVHMYWRCMQRLLAAAQAQNHHHCCLNRLRADLLGVRPEELAAVQDP